MGVSGLEQLEALERELAAMRTLHTRAAARAVAPLLAVARSEWSAGEGPSGASWDPLKEGGGTPLSDLTSQITGAASGGTITITTPEELKFHQGGFVRGSRGEFNALREAQAQVRSAKADADKERLTRARARVRNVKKEIKARGTPVAKRPTLPGRRSMPVPWGRAIYQAIQDEIDETMRSFA